MEGFIHIVKKKSFEFLDDNTITKIINSSKNAEHFLRTISNHKIQSVYYTNEYASYPYNISDQHLFCPVGQFTIQKDVIESNLFASTDGDKRNFISNLEGAFILSTVDFTQNTIDIYTHTVRAESAYIFEDDEKIVIGTDPLLVSIFSDRDLKPNFDSSNFISFFEQGYFADERTPYLDVICLPENNHIKINDHISYTAIDDSFNSAFTQSPDKDFYDAITQNFLDSFNIVNDPNVTIRSGLTGGKDSRLVLLALLTKGFDVETHTTGFFDHPDVIVAKKLAEVLDVPHTTNERKLNRNNQLNISLEQRLKNIMFASSGLISAYDSVNTKTEFKDNKNFNGVAASVITGGFNRFNRQSNQDVTNALKKHVYKFSDYYINQNNKYNQFLSDFSNESNDIDILLHLFFLKYRTGRWTSDSRKAKMYSSNSYSVFLDNQLTKTAMKLNIQSLRQERIHYEIIERLNPEVNRIPFFKYRYKFEENNPLNPSDYSNWLKREPIQAKSKIGSYNWRSLGNNDSNLVNEFKNIILDHKHHKVFDVLQYDKIETLLNEPLSNRTNKFLWSIASMIYYMSIWSDTQKIKMNNKITLNVNPDSLEEININTRLVNHNPTIESLNDAIQYNNKSFKLLNNGKNMYLKTFSGGFSSVPESKNISDVKSIKFNTNLYMPNYTGNIRKSIIFYTENKRFKTVTITNNIKENDHISIFDEITVPKGAVYYRIVILFKGFTANECRLNYSFARLNM